MDSKRAESATELHNQRRVESGEKITLLRSTVDRIDAEHRISLKLILRRILDDLELLRVNN